MKEAEEIHSAVTMTGHNQTYVLEGACDYGVAMQQTMWVLMALDVGASFMMLGWQLMSNRSLNK